MDNQKTRNTQQYKNRRNQYLGIVATVLLVLVLIFCIYSTNKGIGSFTTEIYFGNFKSTTSRFAQEVKLCFNSNEKTLEALADILADQTELTTENLAQILPDYNDDELYSQLAVLFPNDTVIAQHAVAFDATGILSFKKEAPCGTHIALGVKSLQNETEFVLRHFTPIIRDGDTIGLLYGVIELERLSQIFSTNINNGKASLSIAKGSSGGFLLNACPDILDNFFDFKSRRILPEYDILQTLSDIENNKSGDIAFVVKETDDNFYMYYAPVGINDWFAILTISEKTALKQLDSMQPTMLNLFGITIIAFVCFLIIFMIRSFRDLKIYEEQLSRVNYMSRLQELLFKAHRKDDAIPMALLETAAVMKAEKAFLFLLEDTLIVKEYSAKDNDYILNSLWEKFDIKKDAPSWFSQFSQHKCMLIHNFNPEPLYKKLKVRNIIIAPVFNSNKELRALLGAADMSQLPKDTHKLEQGALSFSMAVDNMDVHLQIEEMSMVDYGTGVMNKNSYLKYLTDHNRDLKSLCCIYIDVNGLHEWNNTHGHDAGDRMLRFIAQTLAESFLQRHTYRIGGDEFVIMCPDMELSDTEKKIQDVTARIETEGYFISIGMVWRNTDLDIHAMIEEADAKMYQNKAEFYEKRGKIVRNKPT